MGPSAVRPASHPQAWLIPNILSLDAPIIALCWTVFFARCLHTQLPVAAVCVLVGCVWLIYVADRVADAFADGVGMGETARHRFYRLHGLSLWPFCAGALVVVSWAAFTELPPAVIRFGWIVALLAAVHMVFTHVLPPRVGRFWPKEVSVAAAFALGVTAPSVPRMSVSVWWPAMVAFGLLCWLNCVAIERWERAARWNIKVIAAGVVLGVAVLSLAAPVSAEPLFLACGLSAAILWIIDCVAGSLSADVLRVAADAALLTPLLLLPLL